MTAKSNIDALALARELGDKNISTSNIVDKIFDESVTLLPYMIQIKGTEESSLATTCRALTEILS